MGELEEAEKKIIEREDFIVRVSAIFGLQYEPSKCKMHIRLKNGGYIQNIIMSEKEFIKIKDEFKAKINYIQG